MSDKANSRLYGYRTMSKQSFDTNFSSLGLSVIMICVFFTCIPPYAFSIVTQIPKDVITIHENKIQVTYEL